MSNGKTDPLSRYTATGSTTAGKVTSPSSVANPYGAGAWFDYRAGKWMPKPGQGNAAVNFIKDVGQSGPQIAQNLVAIPAMPFDRNARESMATQTGNALSQGMLQDVAALPFLALSPNLYNQARKRIPGAMDIVEPLGGGFERGLRTGANVISEMTGVTDFTKAGDAIREGRYRDAAGHIMWGGGKLYAGSQTLGAPRTVSMMGTPFGTGFTQPMKAGEAIGNMLARPIHTALGTAASTAGSLFFGEKLFDGQPQQVKSGAVNPTTQRVSPDRYEEMQRREQQQAATNFLTTPQYDVTPYGATIKQTFTDDAGRVYTWDPNQKTYYISGTTAPTGGVKGLSATEQMLFDMNLRDIDRETEALINELQTGLGSRRAETQRDIESFSREAAGGAQDIASQLAILGMDTSPGIIGPAQEAEYRVAGEKQAAARRSLADYITDVEGRVQAARADANARKQRAILENQQYVEQKLLEQADRDLISRFMGGY